MAAATASSTTSWPGATWLPSKPVSRSIMTLARITSVFCRCQPRAACLIWRQWSGWPHSMHRASPPYAPPVRLAIQPQGGSATAVIEGLVGGIVLHIRLPGAGHHGGGRVHIVLLLGLIPLKLSNDLLACLQGLGPPLFLEHGRDPGVIDIASVLRLVWNVPAIRRAIWVPGATGGTIHHALVLALRRSRHIRAVLLELQLGFD